MTMPFSLHETVTFRSWAWRPAWRVPATLGRQRTCWYWRLHSDPATDSNHSWHSISLLSPSSLSSSNDNHYDWDQLHVCEAENKIFLFKDVIHQGKTVCEMKGLAKTWNIWAGVPINKYAVILYNRDHIFRHKHSVNCAWQCVEFRSSTQQIINSEVDSQLTEDQLCRSC